MKKTLLALLSLLGSPALAQQLPQQNTDRFFITKQLCVPVLDAMTIANQYGEQLLFTGNAVTYDTTDTPYMSGAFFFVNQDTGTWSIINVYGDGLACLVNLGSDFAPYTGPRD